MIDDPLKPYEIPSRWTAEHVMVRMIWAFETLARMRIKVGPKGYGRGWPAYVHEWADLVAQEETEAAEVKRRTFERRDVILPPSARDVSLMEEAFQWPPKYLGGGHIGPWASRRATGRGRNRQPIHTVLREADILARHLQLDRVLVR